MDEKTEKHITELLKHCILNNSTGFNLEAIVNDNRKYKISFKFELIDEDFVGVEKDSNK